MTKIRGAATHPVPPADMFKDVTGSGSLVDYFQVFRTARADIGLDMGANLIDLPDFPLQQDTSYLFFTYTTPVGKQSQSKTSIVIDPHDPAFLFHYDFLGAQGISITSFGFGISLKGQIPFKFKSWSDRSPINYFDQFTETFNLNENEIDWLGEEFEGFTTTFGEDPGFKAHLYYSGAQTFSAYAGKLHVEGAVFSNVDPDENGVSLFGKNGRDVSIGLAGQVNVTLNLFDIGRIVLDTESNAIISHTENEKAVYFHGYLENETTLGENGETPVNENLLKVLPVNLKGASWVEISGLIDDEDHARDFIRLYGELALDFETRFLRNLLQGNENITPLLKNFGSVVGEIRANQKGIWVQGHMTSGAACPFLRLEENGIVELFIDTSVEGPFQNDSYLKVYGRADAAFGVTVDMSLLLPLPPGTRPVRITSMAGPSGLNSSVAAGMILSRKGIFVGGMADGGIDIHSAVKLGSSITAKLSVDFSNIQNTYLSLKGDSYVRISNVDYALHSSSSSAEICLKPSKISISGGMKFALLDLYSTTFDVTGAIGLNDGLSLYCKKYERFNVLNLYEYRGYLTLNGSTGSLSVDASGNLYSKLLPACHSHVGGSFSINTNASPPQLTAGLLFSNPVDDIINCVKDILGGGCIVAGSLVTMADGTEKPIEAIKPGEYVMTTHGARKVAVNDVATAIYPFEVIWDGEPTGVTIEHGFILEDGSIAAFDVAACRQSLPGIEGICAFPPQIAQTLDSFPLTLEKSQAVYNLILEWTSDDDAYNLGYRVNGRAVTDFTHPYCQMSDQMNILARWALDHREDILHQVDPGIPMTVAEMELAVIDYSRGIVHGRKDDVTTTASAGEDCRELLHYLSTLPEREGLILWKTTTTIGRLILALE